MIILDEIISNAEFCANEYKKYSEIAHEPERSGFKQYEEEHRQLAEWLKDYKRLKEQEPKTGKWIYGEHDIAMCDGYWCDKCGFFVPWDYNHKSIDFINDYHFCPNCGDPKMIETQERSGEE